VHPVAGGRTTVPPPAPLTATPNRYDVWGVEVLGVRFFSCRWGENPV